MLIHPPHHPTHPTHAIHPRHTIHAPERYHTIHSRDTTHHAHPHSAHAGHIPSHATTIGQSALPALLSRLVLYPTRPTRPTTPARPARWAILLSIQMQRLLLSQMHAEGAGGTEGCRYVAERSTHSVYS